MSSSFFMTPADEYDEDSPLYRLQPDEKTCSSCFLVLHTSRFPNESDSCRDCQ